jgi:hypothetical protein
MHTPKRALILSVLIAAVALATAVPSLATDMFTSAGVTTNVSSTCPTGVASCFSGWFALDAAYKVTIRVRETTGSGTGTVTLTWRQNAADDQPAVLHTWTNPTSTEVPIGIWPPSGQVKLTITNIGAGARMKAAISAFDTAGRVIF